MRSSFDGHTPTRRPERYRQSTSALLRQLNLLICGGDVEELQDLVAALISTQAYATARLLEERRARQAKMRPVDADGAQPAAPPTAPNGAAHAAGANGTLKPERRDGTAQAGMRGNDGGTGSGNPRGARVGNGTRRGGRAA
jgi:hypothetical protein